MSNKYLSHIQDVHREHLQLIALSGGCDSVTLLHLLRSEGFRLHAVHCNFHLRGDESDRDETFCRQLCEAWEIPLTVKHFATTEYAQAHHIGIEMAARELRYDYFEQLRQELSAEHIFVGTHANDNLETFFINLFRGTGQEGLAGIKPVRGPIVRPLLQRSREEILDYARQQGLSWVEDATNNELTILRNRIRHELLPLLQTIHPNALQGIHTTMQHLATSLPLLQEATQEKCAQLLKDQQISNPQLLSEPAAPWLLYALLRPYGFHSAQATAIFEALPAAQGRRWTSESHLLQVHDNHLLLLPLTTATPPVITFQQFERDDTFQLPRSAEEVALDAATIQFPVSIQPVAPGMRFTPYGMTQGTKLVNDYLAEHHIPAALRPQQFVLTDAAGHILWLVGHTIDHHYRITPDTQQILRCTVNNNR